MDKEYLENYLANEEKEIDKFLGDFLRVDLYSSYPDKSRFHKLKEPIGIADKTNSIWPQIPLFGSLLIQVEPTPEDLFYKSYGITKKDFDGLIDFCKDTGKVQFLINGNPKSFVGLEYLAPLFEELHSPLSFNIPLQYHIDTKKLKNYHIEYDTIINLPAQTGSNCMDYLKYIAKNSRTRFSFNEILYENWIYYSFFKEYGYDEIIEKFENLALFDSEKAIILLGRLGELIVDTKRKSFKADYIFSLENLIDLSSSINKPDLIENNNIHEIGKFLLNKLTYMPEGFEACKDVIARYKQEDLYKVSSSLHEGVIKQDQDLVCKKNIELSEILDNVWSDAKLENRIKGVNYGIPFSMALVGTLASGALLGEAGLLAGLGVKVVSEILNRESIGEKLAKKTIHNHVVNIFDFKKKYNIKKQ
jgi:hypothetical protein